MSNKHFFRSAHILHKVAHLRSIKFENSGEKCRNTRELQQFLIKMIFLETYSFRYFPFFFENNVTSSVKLSILSKHIPGYWNRILKFPLIRYRCYPCNSSCLEIEQWVRLTRRSERGNRGLIKPVKTKPAT